MDDNRESGMSVIPIEPPKNGVESISNPSNVESRAEEKEPQKIDRRRLVTGKRDPTNLSSQDIDAIVFALASNASSKDICSKYHIGNARLLDIKNNNQHRIDKLSSQIALNIEKELNPKLLQSINNALNELLTSKKLNKAKYGEISRAIADLNKTYRLNTGQATENVMAITKDMSDEQLKEYIMTGVVETVTKDK